MDNTKAEHLGIVGNLQTTSPPKVYPGPCFALNYDAATKVMGWEVDKDFELKPTKLEGRYLYRHGQEYCPCTILWQAFEVEAAAVKRSNAYAYTQTLQNLLEIEHDYEGLGAEALFELIHASPFHRCVAALRAVGE